MNPTWTARLAAAVSWRRLLRMLAVLAGIYVLGVLLLRLWIGSLTGFGSIQDQETAAMVGMNWAEMALAQSEIVGHFERHGAWPENARAFYRPDDNGLLRIDVPEPFVLRFGMGRGFAPETGLRETWLRTRFDPATRRWDCQNDTPPLPKAWLRGDCVPPGQIWTPLEWLLSALIVGVALLILLLGGLAFLDPRLAGLRKQPRRLRRQPISELPRLHRQLGWLRRRRASLAAAEIAESDWQEALSYSSADDDARAQLLALRVSARCTRSPGWSLPGQVYEWKLSPNLPLALDRALLYLPAADIAPRDLVRHLQSLQTGQDVLLVATRARASDSVLMAYASDTANLCVCLDQITQSEWLLHPSPQEVLVAVLARQLRITRISPYQTRGGITRPAAFFGREQLLARVLNREPGNYLLVGGRQLGKTSLMKAIERRFAEHPRVYCHYLSLRDHRLGARLAAELDQPAETPIEALVTLLAARAGERRVLLLIDETDLFLREESRSGYAQLASLRSLSEEGRCHFMLAGFWDLYQATAIDYASPIRNFGEVITLGALEADACTALATEPLARLGVKFAPPELVQRLVQGCGQRANLVAILCQHGLEQLERGERVLTEAHLESAMASDALLDALAGWARLSPDPADCALDRIIVYRIAQLPAAAGQTADAAQAALTLVELMQLLSSRQIAVAAEAVRGAFARLQLAYVVQRRNAGFAFAVPLFAAQFHAQEVDALLERELLALSSASDSTHAGGV